MKFPVLYQETSYPHVYMTHLKKLKYLSCDACSPFDVILSIHRKLVLGIIGGYMGVQAGFGMMPYYFGELRFYVSSSSMCLFDPIILLWADNNRAALGLFYITTIYSI